MQAHGVADSPLLKGDINDILRSCLSEQMIPPSRGHHHLLYSRPGQTKSKLA